jgi:alcohol dehydrogenase class IV
VNDALGGPTDGTISTRAENSVRLVEKLNADAGLATRLRDVGVTPDMIAPMAKFAYTLDLNWWTNPRDVNEVVMARLYREAY